MKIFKKWYPLGMLLGLYFIANTIAKPLERSIMVASSQDLKDMVIVVDAGHGGMDNGASAQGVKEDELNLAVAMELKDILEMAGAEVILTRDGDYDLASKQADNRKREDLKKRVELMESHNVALFISIHMNKFGNSQVSGAQVFYRVADEHSKLLASCIQEAFKELNSSKLVKMGNYYILNETVIPGVLVECGFMSHPEELALLQQHSYQVKVAHAIYQGIVSYIKTQYGALT